MSSAFPFLFAISSTLILRIVNGQCDNFNDCNSCVESDCAWVVGSCLMNCQMIGDASCYSFDNFPQLDATEICETKDNAEADSRTCFEQKDCSGCTQTLKSDNASFCEWYAEDILGTPFQNPTCGTGGCNLGGCGSSTCTTVNPTLPDCSSINDCTSCLENNCAWVPEFGCMPSCDIVADTSCFSEEYSMEGETASDICFRMEIDQQKEEFCSAAEDCACCTDLVQNDDATTCQWYTEYPDGSILDSPYCGTGGCDRQGVCGSTTCIDDTSSSEVGAFVPQCFAGNNQVLVRGSVGMKTLDELRIGDYVQVENAEYSRIYSFGHVDPSRKSSFLQIYSNNRKSPLEMTRDHLLFIKSKGQITSTAASLIKIGDEILLPSGETTFVTNIHTVSRRGVYAPFTEKGTIVVSGVVTSCYTTLQVGSDMLHLFGSIKTPFSMHWLSHLAVSPRRFLCRVHWGSCQTEHYTIEGLATWVHVLWELANFYFENDIEILIALSMILAAAFLTVVVSRKRKITS